MQEENFSNYHSWFEGEMEYANGVRKRKWISFWKSAGILLGVCAVILLISFVVDVSSEEEILAMAVVWVILMFTLLTLILFLCILPGFFKGKYVRSIKRAMKQQGFHDTQREQFAQEQLAARRDPAKSVSVVITKGQDRMPANFTLSEHFACFTGGTGFGPYIIRVDDTEAFHVSTNTITLPTITRVALLIIKIDHDVTTHCIHFVGHGTEQGRFQFGDPAVCEKVLNILRHRFPEV